MADPKANSEDRGPDPSERHTNSGIPLRPVYSPRDLEGIDYQSEVGEPGEYPYVRGLYPTGYRKFSWMKRELSGYGLPEETNLRQKQLMALGQEGYGGQFTVMIAFDYPTNYGYDSDHPLAITDVGKGGVLVDSIEDMERLFDGLPIETMHSALVIDTPAPVVLAMFIAYAESRGVPRSQLRGSITNNPLSSYVGNNMHVFSPRVSLKLMMDEAAFCTREMPLWNHVNLIAYCMRESGATAVQEVAFIIALAVDIVRAGIKMGLELDGFAPRLSFHFAFHNHIFEEVSKIRAARKIWARIMREQFKAENPKSWQMRIYAQTSGVALTRQEPMNNISRVTLQALSAVLAGCQSLHTASYDEVYEIPSELAQNLALRTQQIIEHETGAADVVDPLGGSYYVEWLTSRIEQEALVYLDRIEKMGGYVEALEKGYLGAEIARSAMKFQREVDEGKRIIVGVNKFQPEESLPVDVFEYNPKMVEIACQRLADLRQRRDAGRTQASLEAVRQAAGRGEPLMPLFIEAVKAYATLGEVMEVLKQVYGETSRSPVLASYGA
ncbi:MAG: methylmalonyl-CoA mutase family protein [Dehalococcoidia bacterium]|nr:methylmalonyl-CoA mutase family protein [Dehalococcoidia bacterium]